MWIWGLKLGSLGLCDQCLFPLNYLGPLYYFPGQLCPRTPHSATLRMLFGCCQTLLLWLHYQQSAEDKPCLGWDPNVYLACVLVSTANIFFVLSTDSWEGGHILYFMFSFGKLRNYSYQERGAINTPWIWGLPIIWRQGQTQEKTLGSNKITWWK